MTRFFNTNILLIILLSHLALSASLFELTAQNGTVLLSAQFPIMYRDGSSSFVIDSEVSKDSLSCGLAKDNKFEQATKEAIHCLESKADQGLIFEIKQEMKQLLLRALRKGLTSLKSEKGEKVEMESVIESIDSIRFVPFLGRARVGDFQYARSSAVTAFIAGESPVILVPLPNWKQKIMGNSEVAITKQLLMIHEIFRIKKIAGEDRYAGTTKVFLALNSIDYSTLKSTSRPIQVAGDFTITGGGGDYSELNIKLSLLKYLRHSPTAMQKVIDASVFSWTLQLCAKNPAILNTAAPKRRLEGFNGEPFTSVSYESCYLYVEESGVKKLNKKHQQGGLIFGPKLTPTFNLPRGRKDGFTTMDFRAWDATVKLVGDKILELVKSDQ